MVGSRQMGTCNRYPYRARILLFSVVGDITMDAAAARSMNIEMTCVFIFYYDSVSNHPCKGKSSRCALPLHHTSTISILNLLLDLYL